MKNKASEKGNDKTGDINIITIGILCERKNQMEIIRFILKCRMHKKKVRLTLLGENNTLYGERCKKFVLEYGLQDMNHLSKSCFPYFSTIPAHLQQELI